MQEKLEKYIICCFLIFFIQIFFQPTNGRFCRLELSNTQCRLLARTACYLFDFLVEAASFEADKILDDFLKDFQDCIISLIHSGKLTANLHNLSSINIRYSLLILSGGTGLWSFLLADRKLA